MVFLQYTPHDVFRINVVQPWWYHAALPHSPLDVEPICVSVSRSDNRLLLFVQFRYQLDNVDRESHLLHRVPQLRMANTVKCLRIINEISTPSNVAFRSSMGISSIPGATCPFTSVKACPLVLLPILILKNIWISIFSWPFNILKNLFDPLRVSIVVRPPYTTFL